MVVNIFKWNLNLKLTLNLDLVNSYSVFLRFINGLMFSFI